MVHGDDFTILGTEAAIRNVESEMRRKYQIKMRGILGPDRHDQREIIILNRILRWTSSRLEYEPDPRHAEIIVDEMGVSTGKPVATPGDEQATRYRALVARAKFLAQDHADL